MKTYLSFREVPNPGKKTKCWQIVSTVSQERLGLVKFHAPWRKYVAYFDPGVIFDAKCLGELSLFLVEHHNDRCPLPVPER